MIDVDSILQTYSAQDLQRFWSKVDKTPGFGPQGECWVWTRQIGIYGYGSFTVKTNCHMHAHRVAFWLTYGHPHDLLVCHKCDHRSCVRPDHLFLGTYTDNMQDMLRKGRGAVGDRHPSRTNPNHNQRISEGRLKSPTRPIGIRNPNAKLTEAQVREIRKQWSDGTLNSPELANIYQVQPAAICKIISRRTWKHI